MLADWIAREKNPRDFFADAFNGADNHDDLSDHLLKEKRNHTRVDLLKDNWEQYRNQNVDWLDGSYKEKQIFVEIERVAQLETRYRALVEKGIQAAEQRMETKFSELLAGAQKAIPQLKEPPNESKSRKQKTADTEGRGRARKR